MSKENYQTICQKVLRDLPDRQKEVIERRFGLGSGQAETLQNIGSDFGITRERVRQIEKESFNKLREQDNDLEKVFYEFKSCLKKKGNIEKENMLLQELGGNNFQNQVHFLLVLGRPFFRFSEDNDVFAFWSTDKEVRQEVSKLISVFFKKLKQADKPLNKEQVFNCQKNCSPAFCDSVLAVAKNIGVSPLGEVGLTQWSEIRPRGVKDSAFLALKKTEKPLHFREIAQIASGMSLKNVLPQTVHNELIRDERFVLVGRGIYALKEWGYSNGTVKDVIYKVLETSSKPLEKGRVVDAVLKERLVKPNTILLNLNNYKCFKRDSDGRYYI